MANLSDRVRNRRKTLNLSQAELGRRVGAKPQVIQALESNPQQRTTKYLLVLAKALGTTAEWLAHGRGPETKQELLSNSLPDGELCWVPIVTWREAVDLARGLPMLHITEAPTREFHPLSRPNHERDRANLIAIIITDDSMVPSSGNSIISFVPKSIIFVDTFADVHPGDFVVAMRRGSKEALLRQYRVLSDDPLRAQLIPLNQNYPQIEFNEDQGDVIIGRMMEHTRKY